MKINPDFIIAGAAKSGTTSLYGYLKQHPDVFFPHIKEPRYFISPDVLPNFRGPGDDAFNKNAIWRTDEYLALYDQAKDGQLTGEASPGYLFYPHAPENIRQHNPETKIIAILRNPVDRAHSAFLHMHREKRETCADFLTAFERSKDYSMDERAFIWHYAACGNYFQQLKKFYEIFPPEQILVLIFEDFIRDPKIGINQIYDFLQIAPYDNVDFTPLNPRKSRPSRRKQIVESLLLWKNTFRKLDIVLDSSAREQIYNYYREEIDHLGEFLNIDLEGFWPSR